MMDREHPLIALEKKTVEAMIRISCSGRHEKHDGLCEGCQELLDYALARLDHCPFHGEKPTCARCPIHCYRPEMRDQIRSVKRYAGPRMILRHPLLVLGHAIDWLRRRPAAVFTRERQARDA